MVSGNPATAAAETTAKTIAKKAKPATFDRLAKKKPIQVDHWIPLDDAHVSGLREASDALDHARLLDRDEPAKIEAAEQALEDAQRAARENSVKMVFRAIGRVRYEEIRLAHPPTEEQNAEHFDQFQAKAEYNPDTFPAALIAASCIEPVMSEEQVASLIESEESGGHGWNAGEFQALFQIAMTVNTQRRVVDLGN